MQRGVAISYRRKQHYKTGREMPAVNHGLTLLSVESHDSQGHQAMPSLNNIDKRLKQPNKRLRKRVCDPEMTLKPLGLGQ